jgi:hypothetical protein
VVELSRNGEDGLLVAGLKPENRQAGDVLEHINLQPSADVSVLDLESTVLFQVFIKLGGDEFFHVQMGHPAGALGDDGRGQGPGPGGDDEDESRQDQGRGQQKGFLEHP